MIATSALYKSILAEPDHVTEWRIEINGTVYGTDKIASSAGGGDSRPKLTRRLFSGQLPEIGACVAGQFDCALFEASANIPPMASVKPSYRLTGAAGASEWIGKGEYFIDTRKPDKASGTLLLHCFDAMLKADGENGKPYAQLTAFETWPQPEAAVAAEIAALIGLTVDPRSVIGSGAGHLVSYPNDYTMREVLGFIGAANGGCWTVTDAPALRLVPIFGTGDAVTLGWKMTKLSDPPALSAWTGAELYYMDEASFFAGSDAGRVLTATVPWATQATADGVLAAITGKSYQPYTAEGARLDLAAELGDTVEMGGAGSPLSGSLSAPVFSITTTCGADGVSSIGAPMEEELDHEYPYSSAVQRTLRRKVGLGVPYYGTSISRENGIVIERSDGLSEATFNSDLFQMSALIDGVMTPRIYFDPVKGDYIFDGALGADAVFTDSLYAETGDVAELTVDRLSTSRRIRKYILGDTSDDNYIRIEGEYIRFVTGTLNPTVVLLSEDGLTLLSEDCDALLEEDGSAPPPVQAVNRYGAPLYWQRQPVGHTSDGYPLDADGVQIYATTDETAWPVYVYDYTELTKAAFSFEQLSENYIPTITLGAGDENGRLQGLIRKLEDSFDLWLTATDGTDRGIFIGNDYTDLAGLRKPTELDFSSWDAGFFTETLDGDLVNGFEIEFDENANPVKFTDEDGHETEVIW